MLPDISGTFRVVRDARTGTYDNGDQWATARVMASRSVRNRDTGQWEKKETYFATLRPPQHLVDDVAALRDGDEVFVTGGEFTDEFTGRDGQRRSTAAIKVRQVRLLQRRSGGGSPAGASGWAGQGEAAHGTDSGDFGGGFGGHDEAPF